MSPPDPAGTLSPVSLGVCGKRTRAREAGATLPVWSVASGRAGRTTVWVCSPVSGAAGGRRVWFKSVPWLRAGGTTAPSGSLVSGGVPRSIVRLKSLPWRRAVGARVRLRSPVSREAAGPTVPEGSSVSGDSGRRTVRLRPLPCRGAGGEVTGSVGGAGVSSGDGRTGPAPASPVSPREMPALSGCVGFCLCCWPGTGYCQQKGRFLVPAPGTLRGCVFLCLAEPVVGLERGYWAPVHWPRRSGCRGFGSVEQARACVARALLLRRRPGPETPLPKPRPRLHLRLRATECSRSRFPPPRARNSP